MRYFIDTEFIEDGRTIDLLSVAICAEDGRDLYLQNGECDRSKANLWVMENVLPHLDPWDCWRSRYDMAVEIQNFCTPFQTIHPGPPEFWGYYAAYDWVALCQLFGDMSYLPPTWPMYCHDYRQWLDEHHRENIKQPDDAIHHALKDAQWLRESFMVTHITDALLSQMKGR